MVDAELTATDIASCRKDDLKLTCAGKVFASTSLLTGTYVTSVNKMVYVGLYEENLFATVVNVASNTISSYTYTSDTMAMVRFSKSQSPVNNIAEL